MLSGGVVNKNGCFRHIGSLPLASQNVGQAGRLSMSIGTCGRDRSNVYTLPSPQGRIALPLGHKACRHDRAIPRPVKCRPPITPSRSNNQFSISMFLNECPS